MAGIEVPLLTGNNLIRLLMASEYFFLIVIAAQLKAESLEYGWLERAMMILVALLTRLTVHECSHNFGCSRRMTM